MNPGQTRATGDDRREQRRDRTALPRVAVALCVLAVIGFAFVRGRSAMHNPDIKLGAAPFVGSWDVRINLRSLFAPVIAVVGIAVLPRWSRTWPLWRLAVVCSGLAMAFGWALAVVDGWSAIIEPVIHPTEYWKGVRTAAPLHQYLDRFVERGLYHSVHVRGHPPGMMVVLITMRAIHLRSPWAAAGLSFIGIGLTVTAVGITVRHLVSEQTARRALPLLAFAPYAIWQVTSADALFTGAAAVSIALVSLAAANSEGGHRVVVPLLGGIAIGICLHLTYGAALVAPLFVAVLWCTRRWRWILPAAVGCALVFAAFRATGYWWFDGLAATRRHYWAGTAKFRSPYYFAAGNVAVLAFAIGLPTAAALHLLRSPRTDRSSALVVASLTAIAIALASQMSKGETERIWLLFMPWLLLAGARFVGTDTRMRLWLGAQAASAVILQAILVSKW